MSEKVQVQRIKNSGTKLWGSLGVLDYTREQFRRNYKHIECSIRMILIAGDDDTAKASHSNDMHHQYLNISSQPHLHNKNIILPVLREVTINILHRKFCT